MNCRPIVATALMACVVSCASAAHDVSTAKLGEYGWAMEHGGCDCNPVAFAPGSAEPSWLAPETLADYLAEKTAHCKLREYVVAAFGDGAANIERDRKLALARTAPFVRRLTLMRHQRVDVEVLAGPHIAHPATLVIFCPTSHLPPLATFQ